VIGVAAALASLAIALYAVKISRGSLAIAEDQHTEFIKELQARADLRLNIRATGNGKVINAVANRVEITWSIEIENVGARPAKQVAVSFGAPRSITDLRWDGSDDDVPFSKRSGRHDVKPDLIASDGSTHPQQAINKLTEHIGRVKRFARVKGTVEIPEEAGTEVFVPARLIVGSDDLPDDVPSLTLDHEIAIRRVEPDFDPALGF
jgi:hypothetical protein